jgi:hypothetical protein
MRPPTPRAQTSTSTGGGNLPPKRPSNGGNSFPTKRVLQVLSLTAGVIFVVGFAVLMVNRGDSTTGSTVSSATGST